MDGSKLCQLSSGQEDDWKLLYETAFPADERSPVDELRKLISSGSMLLHKTVNKDGELLCFSLVNVMSNFALLAYIATDTTKRSSGVGSKHMKQLIQTLRAQYPTFTALFLEIESTKEAGLDADTQKMRNRRLAFYQRLGAKRLKQKYGMPSFAKKGSKAAGELLWIELTNSCVFDADLPNVILEIFQKGYGLPSTDANVQAIIAQWAATVSTSGSTCAISEDPIVIAPAVSTTPVVSSPTSPASSAPAGGTTTDTTGADSSAAAGTNVQVVQPVAANSDDAKTAVTPVVTSDDAKTAVTPKVTSDDAKTAVTPVVTSDDAKTAVAPVVTSEDAVPAKPALEETIAPTVVPIKNDDPPSA